MSMEIARSALRQQLLTVTGLPAGRKWEGEAFEPVDGNAWIAEYLDATSQQLKTFGGSGASDGILQDDGIFSIVVNFPSRKGTKPCGDMAELIRRAFKPGTVLTYSGLSVVCRRAQVAKGIESAKWYSITVRVNFYYHRANA